MLAVQGSKPAQEIVFLSPCCSTVPNGAERIRNTRALYFLVYSRAWFLEWNEKVSDAYKFPFCAIIVWAMAVLYFYLIKAGGLNYISADCIFKIGT